MPISTFEGIVENGQIRLRDDVTLPEKARVYVVIPGLEAALPKAHVYSPRLVHPEQANDFAKQVIEESADAGL
jgi:hypothetical protein